MRLKTLKEIDLLENGESRFQDRANEVIKERLRAEAIKWVKDCERCKIVIYENQVSHACLACNWITYFFNITEEDLK